MLRRLSTCEFLAMITELLVQRDRALSPDAPLTLANALSASPLFVRNGRNRDEIEYDEFAQALREGLFANHFPPDLIARVTRAMHRPRPLCAQPDVAAPPMQTLGGASGYTPPDDTTPHEAARAARLTERHAVHNPSHPWSFTMHYGVCGQNCPCCRSMREPVGAIGRCTICDEIPPPVLALEVPPAQGLGGGKGDGKARRRGDRNSNAPACVYFLNGVCRFGDACRYRHAIDDMEQGDARGRGNGRGKGRGRGRGKGKGDGAT